MHAARTKRSSLQRIFTSFLLAWMLALGAPMPRAALAGPDGAKVVRGDVTVEKVGDTTVIHASDKSIIKFKNFDIAPHETVQFVQPDAKSSVLNKINGAKPTKIEGALLANGRVYLVNRSGVYFAPGAEIHVAEIVAAAGHISNRDFVRGVDRFTDVTGAVQNAGNIHAEAAKLVGATVSNSGFISADDAIVMVSGNDVLLGQRGSRLYVKIGTTKASDPAAPRVEQSGTLEGGRVLLAAGDTLGMAIEHSGATRAADIALKGGRRGTVEVRGTLDASDSAQGASGGRIEVTGERIALRSAELDASGDAGGGEVLVGGDFQGKGPLRTADITFVDPDSRIHADAVSEGDGGKVIVWADYVAGFHGEIGARGGEAGGDGGLVEVSGKEILFFHGDVDTSAPQGEMGLLLLDPVNLTIANGTGDGGSDGTNTFAGDPSGIVGSVLSADTAPTTVFESELEGLAATTNVNLQASNSLVMQNLADDVLGLTTQTGGTVAFTGTGSFSMDASDTIRTEGASISISGGSVTLGNLSTRGVSGSAGGATSTIGVSVTGSSNLTVRGMDAGAAQVTILSVGGSVLDDGSAATRINGGALLIGANGNGASIGSAANPLGTNITGNVAASATTGSGGIHISELSGLVLSNITGGTTKTVGLTAEAGSITAATGLPPLLSGSTLTLTANDAAAAIGTAGAPIRVNFTGPVNASKPNGTGGIFLASAFTGAATTATPLTVGTISAGAGNVTLTGAVATGLATITGTQGSILDDGDISTRISAANLTMTAASAGAPSTSGAGIGTLSNPIGTNITGTLTASAPNGTAGTAAGIFVSEQSGLVVGAINAGPKPIVMTAEAGSITDDGTAGTTIVGNTLRLNAVGAGAGIGTGAAPIRVTLTNSLNAFTPDGTGTFLSETDSMMVGAIDGGNGSVQLISESGSIVDDGSASTLIRGNGLTLQALTATLPNTTTAAAASSIGTAALPITMQDVGTLTARASGSIFARQTQGDLALGEITSTGVQGFQAPTNPQLNSRPGISGGVTIRNDDGLLIVNGPITTFAGTLFNNQQLPIVTRAYTLPGAFTLDSREGIEFGVSTLQLGGNILLNTNVEMTEPPVLASIFRRPGSGDTAADLNLTSTNGSIEVGAGQVLSVPGALTLSALNGTPTGGQLDPVTLLPEFSAVLGSVTLADVNALSIQVDAQRGSVLLREPRTLFEQDGGIVGDGGVDWVANTININTLAVMSTQGSGPRPTFSTPDGMPVANAPVNTRFGPPFQVATPLTPASFVLEGGTPGGNPAPGDILDFRATGGSVSGTPDAVAPVPYPIVRDDGQLERFNEQAAALNPVWGMELLAYLRCSPAAGEDPDAIPIACLGYDPQKQARAPLSGPEGAAVRADYRELLAVRGELRTDLQKAFDAYRAQAQGEPNGADFRKFVEEDPAYGEASNALQSLRRLLDSLDAMLGPQRASGAFESWERDLLLDFTPGNMTPELLFEATGAGSARVQTAGAGQGPNS